MKTTVVIPNFNGLSYLKDCLAALETLKEEFRICVIDNASTDGSVAFLQQFHCTKQLEVFYLEENTGFCHAVNVGIQTATTPYILLLNNDTVVRENFVKTLEEVLDTHEDTFSVSSQMLVMKNPALVDDAGDYYCAMGYAFGAGKGKPATKYQKPCKVFSACGGASIYRKRVFEEIGLFDENHFAYLEDVDVGYRARIHGYVNRYEPQAQVLHAGSAVSGSRHNEFKVNLSSRNSIYLIWKNMPLFQHLLNLPFILLGILIKTVFFLRKGLAGTFLKGVLRGVKMSLGRSGKSNKVRFKWKHFGNYVHIQGELWWNLLRMVWKK